MRVQVRSGSKASSCLLTSLAVTGLIAVAWPVAGQEPPQRLYGPLFTAVQTERIFPDSKTFADATPKGDPADIVRAYLARRPTGDDLRAFVLANFNVGNETGPRDLRTHVRDLWSHLARLPVVSNAGGSALPLSAPYVVPGGRFQEIYYWDSYFTMLGLKADGHQGLVEAMIDNFTALIEQHGHIPNGTRTYYLTRSQPPYFAMMLDLSEATDPSIRARRLAALKAEQAFWMKGAQCVDEESQACLRVVRMPDGSVLNRYYDESDQPRDESYLEDQTTASQASGREAGGVYRDLRAAAESGWDFSSRWLGPNGSLASVRTTQIVPIDLNSLLWAMEQRIATLCGETHDEGCVETYAQASARRKAAIDRYLWQPDEARYGDWDRATGAPTPVLSAATLEPLFVGLASREQADAIARTTSERLLAEGGLRTTQRTTGQQWDAPNGWAPLQWVAISGLDRYGHAGLARNIADRWIGTVDAAYRDTGKMLEKYNVESRAPGGGGEYPLQDGFGWTNGVTSAILDRYPDLTASAPAPAL